MKRDIHSSRFAVFRLLLPVLLLLPAKGSLAQTDSGSATVFDQCWNLFDFCDTLQWHGEHPADSAFEQYLNLQKPLSLSSRTSVLKHLLDKAQNSQAAYQYINRLARQHFYDGLSPWRNDTLYAIVLNHQIASPLLSKEEKERSKYRLTFLQRNSVGAKAENFKFLTTKDKKGKLYSLPRKGQWLVFFFDPECSHCQVLANLIRSNMLINGLIQQHKLSVLAVNTNPDLSLWKRIAPTLPPSWLTVMDKTGVEEHSLYDLRTVPAIYLLDRNKKVILKGTDFSTLFNELGK